MLSNIAIGAIIMDQNLSNGTRPALFILALRRGEMTVMNERFYQREMKYDNTSRERTAKAGG